ncbi:MAG: phage head-tail connector protein [Oscillospiraceae bacterium]|jgi:hypothetical protein|nr:phage head-tail connector protein [Oscillospiraceae bacterium]
MAQIDTLRTLLQIDPTDTEATARIQALITICENQYLNWTHQTTADENTVTAMVIERWNKFGNEGLSSISYSGISEAYSSDYSDEVKRMIRSHTRLVML